VVQFQARNANACRRRSKATDKVIIIGAKASSFVPKVHWDEIVLPNKLKHDLMEDVSSFFTKGVVFTAV